MMTQGLESLPSTWETWMGFQAPGFSLAGFWLLWTFGE